MSIPLGFAPAASAVPRPSSSTTTGSRIAEVQDQIDREVGAIHAAVQTDYQAAQRKEAMLTGYVPIITHPERLTWIEDHYALIQELAGRGVWMQVTAGSLVGRFGSQARYWAERLFDEGLVHLLATDAHGVRNRPPLLTEGRQAAERWVGPQEARRLVEDRPQGVIDNVDPEQMPMPPGLSSSNGRKRKGVDL